LFSWVFLPLMIFFARIIDVSLGTLRVIFISRGFNKYAPLIGFFEVLVWIIATTYLIKSVNSLWLAVVYATGFAAGTYVGIWLEEKISLGRVRLRIIVRSNYKEIIAILKSEDYITTIVKADYGEGDARVISILVNRKKLKRVLSILTEANPNVFYSIEDVRRVSDDDLVHNERFTEKLKNFALFRK